VRVRWSGGAKARVYARNHQWEIGQPASFDVSDPAPSAVEYLLGALGAQSSWAFRFKRLGKELPLTNWNFRSPARLRISLYSWVWNIQDARIQEISGTLYVKSSASESVLAEVLRHTLTVSPIVSSLSRSVRVNVQIKTAS